MVIAIIAAVIYTRINNGTPTEETTTEETAPIAVEAATAEVGNLDLYTELTGTVSADETVNVLPAMVSKVTQLNVKVGDEVAKDAVLFLMNTEDVQTQLNQASNGVANASLSISQTQIGLKNAQLAYSQAQTAYDMANANYEMNLANFQYAQQNLAKYATLLSEGIVSQAEYDQLELQASPETLTLLDKQLEQANAALSAATLGVENAKLAIQQAQTGYNQAEDGVSTVQDTMDDLTMTAPISGLISAVNVVENQYASNAQPAIVITNIDRVKVTVNVTENLINRLSVGEKVEISIPALGEEVFAGTIDTISPVSNMATLLYPVTIYVENPDHIIKPGMFASAKILAKELEQVLFVPTDAILIENGSYYVYLLGSNSYAEKTSVEVGMDAGFNSEIISGLKEGDQIVTTGLGLIDNETLLNIVEEVK